MSVNTNECCSHTWVTKVFWIISGALSMFFTNSMFLDVAKICAGSINVSIVEGIPTIRDPILCKLLESAICRKYKKLFLLWDFEVLLKRSFQQLLREVSSIGDLNNTLNGPLRSTFMIVWACPKLHPDTLLSVESPLIRTDGDAEFNCAGVKPTTWFPKLLIALASMVLMFPARAVDIWRRV